MKFKLYVAFSMLAREACSLRSDLTAKATFSPGEGYDFNFNLSANEVATTSGATSFLQASEGPSDDNKVRFHLFFNSLTFFIEI